MDCKVVMFNYKEKTVSAGPFGSVLMPAATGRNSKEENFCFWINSQASLESQDLWVRTRQAVPPVQLILGTGQLFIIFNISIFGVVFFFKEECLLLLIADDQGMKWNKPLVICWWAVDRKTILLQSHFATFVKTTNDCLPWPFNFTSGNVS